MFTTDRLRLRAYRSSDESLVFDFFNTANVAGTFFGGDFSPKTEKASEKVILQLASGSFFAIIEVLPQVSGVINPDELFIGIIGVHSVQSRHRCGEFYIGLTPSVWGKGYAQEAAKFVVQHSFLHLGLNRLQLGVFDDNPKAKKLYERVYAPSQTDLRFTHAAVASYSGFKAEGHREEIRWVNGGFVGETMMGILSRNWFIENPNP